MIRKPPEILVEGVDFRLDKNGKLLFGNKEKVMLAIKENRVIFIESARQ